MKRSIYSVIYGEENIYEDKGGAKKEIQRVVNQSTGEPGKIRSKFASMQNRFKSFFNQRETQRFENGASVRHDPLQSRITTNSPPLTDLELKSILAGKKSIFEDFPPWRIYNTLFCESGIDDVIRGSIWCKLLGID